MVAFCAMCTIQSIHFSPYDSDWALFRIATLQELVSELERQAGQRHPCRDPEGRTVVDAMAKQLHRAISMALDRPRRQAPLLQDDQLPDFGDLFAPVNDPCELQIPLFDDWSHFFGTGSGLPDMAFGDGVGQGQVDAPIDSATQPLWL